MTQVFIICPWFRLILGPIFFRQRKLIRSRSPCHRGHMQCNCHLLGLANVFTRLARKNRVPPGLKEFSSFVRSIKWAWKICGMILAWLWIVLASIEQYLWTNYNLVVLRASQSRPESIIDPGPSNLTIHIHHTADFHGIMISRFGLWKPIPLLDTESPRFVGILQITVDSFPNSIAMSSTSDPRPYIELPQRYLQERVTSPATRLLLSYVHIIPYMMCMSIWSIYTASS